MQYFKFSYLNKEIGQLAAWDAYSLAEDIQHPLNQLVQSHIHLVLEKLQSTKILKNSRKWLVNACKKFLRYHSQSVVIIRHSRTRFIRDVILGMMIVDRELELSDGKRTRINFWGKWRSSNGTVAAEISTAYPRARVLLYTECKTSNIYKAP